MRALRALRVIGGGALVWAGLALVVDAAGSGERPQLQAEVVVVLGCAPDEDGTSSACLERRVGVALERWRAGGVGAVAVCGGAAFGTTEADVSAGLLIAGGVPASAIVREDRSTSTWENALLLRAELPAARVVLATDGAHLPRALAVFRRFYEEVSGAPATPPPGQRALLALREVPAWGWYLLSRRLGPLAAPVPPELPAGA